MAHQERKKIIEAIQESRGSKVITYVMGDRQTRVPIAGMGAKLASEPQLLVYDHLRAMGKVKKIDLFLYTRGGEVDSVMPLANAIREFCEIFSVLVPFRAHSGGTLICLAADEIVMGPFGELSPVDPMTGNQFSPVDELNPKARKGISVEDVTSYIALAKDKNKVGLQGEAHILEVFKTLSQQVHPLALGHVNRVHAHIRMLAHKLLKLGQTRHIDEKEANEIVDTLTEKLYSHTHAIGRREAQQLLGPDIVKFASQEEEGMLWAMFEEYAGTMNLRERFNIREFMGDELKKEISVSGAFLESEKMSHVFECTSTITQRSELPPNFQVQVQAGQAVPLIPGFPRQFSVDLIREGWKSNEGGT